MVGALGGGRVGQGIERPLMKDAPSCVASLGIYDIANFVMCEGIARCAISATQRFHTLDQQTPAVFSPFGRARTSAPAKTPPLMMNCST